MLLLSLLFLNGVRVHRQCASMSRIHKLFRLQNIKVGWSGFSYPVRIFSERMCESSVSTGQYACCATFQEQCAHAGWS